MLLSLWSRMYKWVAQWYQVGPVAELFLKISYMSSVPSMWIIYISFRCTHYMMWLSWSLVCFISFLLSYFDQSIHVWLAFYHLTGMESSMCDRSDWMCLIFWNSFVHSFVAPNYASQEISLVCFWQNFFHMKFLPQWKVMKLLIEQ